MKDKNLKILFKGDVFRVNTYHTLCQPAGASPGQKYASQFIDFVNSNEFFGKIETLRKGDVQAGVAISTPGGYRISAVITHHSLKRLGLKPGALVAAEVKAPWVTIHRGDDPECSAERSSASCAER